MRFFIILQICPTVDNHSFFTSLESITDKIKKASPQRHAPIGLLSHLFISQLIHRIRLLGQLIPRLRTDAAD
jgi:hypothetical protein